MRTILFEVPWVSGRMCIFRKLVDKFCLRSDLLHSKLFMNASIFYPPLQTLVQGQGNCILAAEAVLNSDQKVCKKCVQKNEGAMGRKDERRYLQTE